MAHRPRTTTLACYLLALATVGCDLLSPAPPAVEPTPPPSVAKEFESDHVGKTITTHGPILPGTVEDAGPNRVRYKTEDGKQWEVETSRDANGNLVSGTPDALGEEPAKKDTQPDR